MAPQLLTPASSPLRRSKRLQEGVQSKEGAPLLVAPPPVAPPPVAPPPVAPPPPPPPLPPAQLVVPAAQPVVPAIPAPPAYHMHMPMYQGTQGYLFPIYGNNARIITAFYDALGPHTLHGFLPHLNPASVFLPVPPFTVQIQPRTILVTTRHGRFLVMYYIDEEPVERPINESLAALTNRIIWKGELVVFSLGKTVPFRSRPSVQRAIINKVVLLCVTRVTVARALGERLPRQIYTVT